MRAGSSLSFGSHAPPPRSVHLLDARAPSLRRASGVNRFAARSRLADTPPPLFRGSVARRAASAALLVALAAVAWPTGVAAQETGDAAGEQADVAAAGDVRVVARRLDDGRVEFGLQRLAPGGVWAPRVLPARRIIGAEAPVGRWLTSSSLLIPTSDEGAAVSLRLAARRLGDGSVEFALQLSTTAGWTDRISPPGRYLPADAPAGRWLVSGPVTPPRPQPPDGAFVAVSSGDEHACGLRADGAVACWGNNDDGQGDPPPGRYRSISAGDEHTCAVRADDAAVCWGNDDDGRTDAPAGRFVAVSSGNRYTCGLRADGAVTCWGYNGQGQAPRAPAGHYSAVSAATFHTCALRTTGTLVCWGENSWQRARPPAGRYSALSVAWVHSCALAVDGTVACWGNNDFVTDTYTGSTVYIGQADTPDGHYVAVSAGEDHTCALRADGTAACWGDNDDGQTDAPPGQHTAISAGDEHTCAVTTTHTITCWGPYKPPPDDVHYQSP